MDHLGMTKSIQKASKKHPKSIQKCVTLAWMGQGTVLRLDCQDRRILSARFFFSRNRPPKESHRNRSVHGSPLHTRLTHDERDLTVAKNKGQARQAYIYIYRLTHKLNLQVYLGRLCEVIQAQKSLSNTQGSLGSGDQE